MRIGIFLPNWIGDVVMATPALRALREHFGETAELVGLLRPNVADVLAGTSWLDETVQYTRKTTRGFWRTAKELRQQRFDTILLLTNSFSTALLARLSGAQQRIGFAMHGRSWLLTDCLYAPAFKGNRMPFSAVQQYLETVEVLGVRTESRCPELTTISKDESLTDDVWKSFGWDADQKVIVLNTGGAYGAGKSWPSEHFSELARRLATSHDIPVLVLCGPAEKEVARGIARQADHPRVVSLAEQPLGIGLSKACVRRSLLMVTTDSGPRHFAAAFKVPAVTLFGPTDPRWSDNYHPDAINVQLDVDCGPCAKRVCPLKHHRCMRELSVSHVLVAAQSLLQRQLNTQAA
jgi:heptosyltransferase-2